MYRIAWKVERTGAEGHGEYMTISPDVIQSMVDALNKKNPGVVHWSENMKTLSLNLKGHRCSYGDLTFIPHESPTSSDSS